MIESEMNAPRRRPCICGGSGPAIAGLIVSLLSPDQVTAERIRGALRARYADLSHVTVEIAVCADCAP